MGGNLRPELHDEDGDGHGQTISFLDGNGAEMLRYSDLFVTDALGKHFPTLMRRKTKSFVMSANNMAAILPCCFTECNLRM